MLSRAGAPRPPDILPDLHVFVVHDDGAQAIGERPGHFGRGIGDAVSHIGEETADVAVLHQTRDTVRDVVEQTCKSTKKRLLAGRQADRQNNMVHCRAD